MPGAMRKLGLYLGLVEDDEDARHHAGGHYSDDEQYGYDDAPRFDDAAPTRAYRTEVGPRVTGRPAYADGGPQTRGSMALDPHHQSAPAPRPYVAAVPEDPYRITTLTPRTYNEARQIGEHFREGTPVIMNLTEMDDVDAKRLVDFAAGLIFGLRGSIERVTNKVFLLSPEHVEVTAEDKALIVEGGFFNQS
jgi:cell division inhibitor SepF